MKEWVVDASIALSWGLSDEPLAARDLLETAEALWVPALWWYEIANSMNVAHRRGRTTAAEASRFFDLLRALPIETDEHSRVDDAWRLYSGALDTALSAYDNAYLDLARRRGLGLATLDSSLKAAAAKLGIAVRA